MVHLGRILAVACLIASGPLVAAETYQLKIDPQPLTTALQQFAKQSGLQIVYFGKVAEGHEAAAVAGNLSAAEALKRLLAGTDLQFEALDRHTIAISTKGAAKTTASSSDITSSLRLAQMEGTENSQETQKVE